MAPISRARAKAELSGPKTRAKKKELEKPEKNVNKKKISERRRSVDSLFGSSEDQKKTNKKRRKKTKGSENDGTDKDGGSDDSDEDHQYIIFNGKLKKKYKVRYYDDCGIEDEIKEMKDPSLKKDNYKVTRAEYIKSKPRCRNVNECVVCDEGGDELVSCIRCPASFHSSCIESAMSTRKSIHEPWICKRCKYEQNILKKPKRVAKVIPFDEDDRYLTTVEETLKKNPDEEITLSKAFDVLSGLANPRSFMLPKDVSDHLADMPYMEHIPRKWPCKMDAVCYSCKEHPSEIAPAIDCDYCPAKFHLHCLESPMTEVLNEFWMCPLHGEIGIDRFVLNTIGISKRMHHWNKCRTKVHPKRVWKEFIKKVQNEPRESGGTKPARGNVPPEVDWKFVKQQKPFTAKEPNASHSDSEDIDMDITEAKFLALIPFEKPKFDFCENEEDSMETSKPFFDLLNPKKHLNRNGFYPPDLMNAKASYFGADGHEHDSSGFTHVPIDELYYPEKKTTLSLAEEAAKEISNKFAFLLDPKNASKPMDIDASETSTSGVVELGNSKETLPKNALSNETHKLTKIIPSSTEQELIKETPVRKSLSFEMLSIAELVDGQICFTLRIYRKTRYYAKYFTDGDQIIVLFKQAKSPFNLDLPKDAYNNIPLLPPPESFVKIISLNGENTKDKEASSPGADKSSKYIIHGSSGMESEYDSDDAECGPSTSGVGTMTDKIKKKKKLKKTKHKKLENNGEKHKKKKMREAEAEGNKMEEAIIANDYLESIQQLSGSALLDSKASETMKEENEKTKELEGGESTSSILPTHISKKGGRPKKRKRRKSSSKNESENIQEKEVIADPESMEVKLEVQPLESSEPSMLIEPAEKKLENKGAEKEKLKKKHKRRLFPSDNISATSPPRPVSKKSLTPNDTNFKIAQRLKKARRNRVCLMPNLLPPIITLPSRFQEKTSLTKMIPLKPAISLTQPPEKEENKTPEFDFSKLMPLECRKVGHHLYLISLQPKEKGNYIIVSRLKYESQQQVLAYPISVEEQLEMRSKKFKFQFSGEKSMRDYGKIKSAAIEFENMQIKVIKNWKPNFGIISATEEEIQRNIDDLDAGEYILDKRFIIPSLSIIGSLFIISPYHSFATIPIYYPQTIIGFTEFDTIDLRLIAPECKFIQEKHCTIAFDKTNCCVYLKAIGYTEVDNHLYGGLSQVPAIENTCKCAENYQKIPFTGIRLSRANIVNDSKIRIGCLKFKVMLLPIEQIWNQIPDSNLKISDTRLPIGMTPTIDEGLDSFEDELSSSSVSNSDSEFEVDNKKDMDNQYVIV